jgi:hypothetical protein
LKVTLLLATIFIGVGTTLFFDLWCWGLCKAQGVDVPDWRLAGRWFGHVAQGRLLHDDMAAARPIANEQTIGWIGHYAIGVLYAAVLVAWQGQTWLHSPTLAPALFIGIVTVLAGWLIMSPGMGNGIAASRAPAPWKTRGLQLLAHAVFGIGLWVCALAFSLTL